MARKIKSLTEYIAAIEQYDNSWFRGVGSSSYTLKPRIHWDNIDKFIEENLVYSFLREHFKYHSSGNKNPWYLYSLMQHHGLPTRLLDWSKSPLVALYFALTQKQVENKPARVWVLDPYKLNNTVMGQEKVFCPSQSEARYFESESYYDLEKKSLLKYPDNIKVKFLFDSYLPANLATSERHLLLAHPLAIETIPLDARMAAQQSTFTIHGESRLGIDELFSCDIINFIDIDLKYKQKILSQLHRLGIVEDIVFCDLDSLVKRLCREQGL